MDRNQSLVREVRAILRSPTFARSPSLSRVLDYLLTREASADGPATQYDIALEAMGKNSDFSEITDSAVRVQMSRLRKALADYYLTHAPMDGLYVHIRTGEYRLRAASLEIAYPDLAKATSQAVYSDPHVKVPVEDRAPLSDAVPPSTNSPTPKIASSSFENVSSRIPAWAEENVTRQRMLRLALPIIALVGLFSITPNEMASPVTATSSSPRGLQAPYIAADYRFDFADSGLDEKLPGRLEDDVRRQLQLSMISRLEVENREAEADYILHFSVNKTDDNLYGGSIILTDRHNKLVTERNLRPEFSSKDFLDKVHDEVTSIVSPAGQITRDLAKGVGSAPENDFECFLLAETSRAAGSSTRGLIDRCLDAHPTGEFSPYLRIRRAFSEAQAQVMSGQRITTNSTAWQETAEVLRESPENPYANALAAKLLIGRGRCADAASFAREAFARGRTYPALELAVIVDAYGCKEVAGIRPFWAGRIARVAQANPEPHALLEAYILIGAVLSDQVNLLNGQRSPAFSDSSPGPLGPMLVALRAAVRGDATRTELETIEASLPSLIFSEETRSNFLMKIRNLHSIS